MKKLIFLSLLCTSSVAFAQISLPNIQISDFPDPVINTEQVLREPVTPNGSSRQPIESVENSLEYTPSKSRTRTNLQTFVNKSRAADPAGAAQLEQLFASTDVIGAVGDAMSSIGLSKNNAADAFAVYWISAWQAANGRSDTRSPETYKAVAAQAARGLSSSPEFANASDAQKQEMAEALMVQAAMIDAGAEQAVGADAAAAQAFRGNISKGATASGLELDKMTLTEDGFVKAKGRKRADASGAVEGEGRVLASAFLEHRDA